MKDGGGGGRLQGLSANWFYATVAVGSIGTTMTAPITALYAKALGASDGMAALVVSTILMTFLLVDVVCSRVVPRVDARTALVGGFLGFGLGSFISALAPNLAVMAFGRLLQGVAVAFPMGAGFHLALRLAQPGREARELARFNTYSFLGLAGGPLIIGLVADSSEDVTGMRWGFALCGVVNVASAVMARLVLPPIPSGEKPEFGLPGRAAFAGRRTRQALNAAGLGFGLRMVAAMTLLPLLGDDRGASPAVVAVATLLMSVTEWFGIALSGRLADSHGRVPVIAVSSALTTLTLLAMVVSPSIPVYLALSATLGFVIAAARVVPAAVVLDVAESDEAAGIGWRVAGDVHSLGAALAISAVFALTGLNGGFVYAALSAAAIGVLAVIIGETRPRLRPVPVRIAGPGAGGPGGAGGAETGGAGGAETGGDAGCGAGGAAVGGRSAGVDAVGDTSEVVPGRAALS